MAKDKNAQQDSFWVSWVSAPAQDRWYCCYCFAHFCFDFFCFIFEFHFIWGWTLWWGFFCFVLVLLCVCGGGQGCSHPVSSNAIFWSNMASQYLYLVSVDLRCSHEMRMRKNQLVKCGDPKCNSFLKGEFIMSELLIPKCTSRTGNKEKLPAETQ